MALGEIGLSIDYFYSLTYRQFLNTVNGYRKKEDAKSRERWLIARKIMYASVAVHAKESFRETDILQFPWEAETIGKITEEEEAEMLERQKISEKFFAKFDDQNK